MVLHFVFSKKKIRFILSIVVFLLIMASPASRGSTTGCLSKLCPQHSSSSVKELRAAKKKLTLSLQCQRRVYHDDAAQKKKQSKLTQGDKRN